MNKWHRIKMLYCFLTAAVVTGCSSTQVSLETDFPSPLVEKQSTPIALIINESLTNFVHTETVEKGGDFVIKVGSAQRALFERIAAGLFSNHIFFDSISDQSISALAIEPEIRELQFATPDQTRTDYYEVWMRYDFKLYDLERNLTSTWSIPAYGKANKNNHTGKRDGLEAAALSACRDVMAVFSIRFSNEQLVDDWLKLDSSVTQDDGE